MAKFYTFRQNNSGGRFKQNNEVDIKVVIEANNAEHANKRAEEIGIYFDGCSKGIDCPCCGDRWYEVYEIDGTDVPSLWGEELSENEPNCKIYKL